MAADTWFDEPMRWGQLTLVENDPGRYDPDFWLDYFERAKCDGVCLSAGGYIAYYPTEIPLHHRSVHMNGSDPFGQLVTGCKERGMRILARTDPHAVHQPVRDEHPDWIAVDVTGNQRPHWAMPSVWVTCALGPYNFNYMTDVHREIMRLYPVDGIFSNRWTGSGMCYCEHCTQNFWDVTGKDLPRTDDRSDAIWNEYARWREERLFELAGAWDQAIREINPDARFVPNSGGGALSDLDMARIGQSADILFADRQGRSGTMAPWAAGKDAKEYRATMGKKPIGGIFGVGIEGRHRWKDSTQHDEELRIWVGEVIANGMRPWFTKFGGVLHDDRWAKVVEDLYTWHHQWERYFRNGQPIAQVGVVYSQQTARVHDRVVARHAVEDHINGVYQALVEARIPFEMIHDQCLAEISRDDFETIVLPNVAALSDEQCRAIERFVDGGGNVVATHETSLLDERGLKRQELGLAQLFGLHLAGHTEVDLKNSYFELRDDLGQRTCHPITQALQGADRIIGGVSYVPVTVGDGSEPPEKIMKQVPAYPDLPMEEVYPRDASADPGAGAYVREYGDSRIVYIPWDIDRTFWEVLDPDHGAVLADSVKWATRDTQPVTVEGSGMIDLTAWRQQDSVTVHLVNLTNPMTMRGAYRELVPLGEQQVRLTLPQGLQAKRVHLLKSDVEPEVRATEDSLYITIPTVLDHEVVAVDTTER